MDNARFLFRAWDNFNEDMFYSDKTKSLSAFFENYEKRIEGGNEPILMQSAGIRDRKGIAIYDGDILQSKYTLIKYIVTYDSARGCFHAKNGNGLIAIANWTESLIIGNIYQNKDLIS